MYQFKSTIEQDNLLKASGSSRKNESHAAVYEIAKAVQTPLRQGVLSGDILGNLFEVIDLTGNDGRPSTAEFPLDFLAPGTEKNFYAYSIPNHGYIPQRHAEGDYIQVPTYDIGNAIDWNKKYARDARWDVVNRYIEVFLAGFTKKWNDDGWQTLITAAADRNIVVLDSDAQAGQFTKRLVSLAKLVMRRNGGGNSTSVDRRKLTDLFISPEAMEDIRNWNVDQVDDVTRREIMLSTGDEVMSRIFGVNLHTLDELGEGQEYQLFYTSELGGSLPSGDVEIAVGLDLSRNDSFVMPVRELPSVEVDDQLDRMRRSGVYGTAEQGFAVLDQRNCILLSM